MIFIIISDDWI